MTVCSAVRARLYAGRIEELLGAYANRLSEQDRLSAQLDLWNAEWHRILASVPYYQQRKRGLGLPERFRSWTEFIETVPVTRRSGVQENTREMTSIGRPPQLTRVSGGSTAEPVQMPAWRSEEASIGYNAWLGRSWYGASPSSRLLLLWGHSHLFGTGIRGWFRARKREAFDRMLGYKRLSAYGLHPEPLRRAAQELIEFKPDYMIGYSVALDLFARANTDRREELRNAGLKVVIGTAECFPCPDSAALLEDLFGCPVAMEYGSVECGVIAHTHPEGGYRVFWRSYFVEGEKDENAPRGLNVYITSLYPRCFPLVRYDLGDQIVTTHRGSERLIGIEAFEKVIGRCNAYAVLKDGSMVHFETFDTAIRDCPQIKAYQVIQDGLEIHVRYLSGEALSQEWMSTIRRRLARIHPDLARVKIARAEQLEQTIAGKTPMVIRRKYEAPRTFPGLAGTGTTVRG
jgi:phenylacetate-coenzyme A ligase PaaK-like adenylate-forming protein